MKKVVESPEWTRLYWVVMAIAAWVILSSLFSCEPQAAHAAIKRSDDFIAQYWFIVGILSVACFVWYRWSKKGLHLFFACMFLIAWLMPYLMMLGLWVILELIP